MQILTLFVARYHHLHSNQIICNKNDATLHHKELSGKWKFSPDKCEVKSFTNKKKKKKKKKNNESKILYTLQNTFKEPRVAIYNLLEWNTHIDNGRASLMSANTADLTFSAN